MTDPTPTPVSTPFMITGKLYDRLKFLALVLLPAISTLYFTMGSIWHFPNIEQVIGSIAALDTFLGVVLKVSNAAYSATPPTYDGHMAIHEKPGGGKLFSLELDGDPEDLIGKKSVTFRVGTPLPPPGA